MLFLHYVAIFAVPVTVFFNPGAAETSMANFTNCTLDEYLCDARKCTAQFIINLQNDPEGNCGVQYNKTLDCVIMSNKLCGRVFPSDPLNKTIDDWLRAGIKEEQMCNEAFLGEFLVPRELRGDTFCSNAFVNNTAACLITFYEKFLADKSDPTLCEEHAKAKKCWMKAITSECKYPSDFSEAIKFELGDYNPFCANNRDPGATGNDRCHGVRDIKNPFNRKDVVSATAGIKVNASLADRKSVV